MRTLTTLLTGAIMSATLCHATILRVNSIANYATPCSTCFQTLPTAYAAALDGDTIHLEPADANYGDLTIQKRVVIIGAGYFLGAAPNNSGLQANTQSSRVNLLTLNHANSSGTVIMGLHFVDTGGGVDISNCNNITIKRNRFEGRNVFFAGGTVSNVLVAENFITGNIGNTTNNQTITNLTIRNNYISGGISLNDAGDAIANLSVLHNTLDYNGNNGLMNAEVAFNVFRQGNITGTNNIVHDNIAATALTGADPGTNPVVNMGNVYNLTVGTNDGKYDILDSSPYNEGGAQARGMYSGISPYKLSGIPNIPAIYSLQSTLSTIPGQSVTVTLSTRSNN